MTPNAKWLATLGLMASLTLSLPALGQVKPDCTYLVQYRDAELAATLGASQVSVDSQKIKIYREAIADLEAQIKDLEGTKPWISADAAALLRIVSAMSDRFIELTSSLVPGSGTKAIGLGYGTLKAYAQGDKDAALLNLVEGKAVDALGNGTAASGALSVAISTGKLVSNLREIGQASSQDKQAEAKLNATVKELVERMKRQKARYQETIAQLEQGKAEVQHLRQLKEWIDQTCG